MKRTSSWTTSNSETSVVPRSRKKATRRCTSSSGALAPEELVQHLIDFFRARGTTDVSEFEVVQEDVRFMLPKEIRKALAARA